MLEADRENIAAALDWSVTSADASTSLRLAVGAAWFWYLRGHWEEAGRQLQQSLALAGAAPTLRGQGEAWAALFDWRRGDRARARQLTTTGLATLAGSRDDGESLCLLVLTLVAISDRDLDQAEAHGRRALDVFRAQGHRWGVTTALLVLTHLALNRQSPDFSALLEESAALLESGPDRWGRAQILNLRGAEALGDFQLDRAHDLYTASHALAVELGDRAGQADNLLALGHLHLLRGEHDEAAQALQESRSLLEQLQDHHQVAHADQALALLAIARGRAAEGEAQLQDVSRRLDAMGLAAMGRAHARSMAALYRRSGQPALAAALLRQALALTDPSQQPTEYAEVQAALADLAAVGQPTG